MLARIPLPGGEPSGRGAEVPWSVHSATTIRPRYGKPLPSEGRGRNPEDGRRLVVLADGFCPGCGRVAPIDSYLAIVAPAGGLVVVDDTQALGVLGTPAPGHPYGRGGGGTARWLRLSNPRLIVVASLAKGFGVPVATLACSDAAVRRYMATSETRVHCSPPSNAHLHSAIAALAHQRHAGRCAAQRVSQNG